MKIRLFYHSLVSDWNHGNAHFLRGVMAELIARKHDVVAYEPLNGWSRCQLVKEQGSRPVRAFQKRFPNLCSREYSEADFRADEYLGGVDLVLVHEWTSPAVIAAICRYRRTHSELRIFFHDTHHRAVTARHEIERLSLEDFDGILVYGRTLKQAYEANGWGKQIYIWHEAADTRIFAPRWYAGPRKDITWIGNWGDDERTAEIHQYLLEPAARMGLSGDVYGVGYPDTAVQQLKDCGLKYRGWTANYNVPELFARHRLTVHITRRPYIQALPGIPTIRPFESLACGIPLISSPWTDVEGLFRINEDFLIARDAKEMRALIYEVLHDQKLASTLSHHGLETIQKRHTCAHRVDELLSIYYSHRTHEPNAGVANRKQHECV